MKIKQLNEWCYETRSSQLCDLAPSGALDEGGAPLRGNWRLQLFKSAHEAAAGRDLGLLYRELRYGHSGQQADVADGERYNFPASRWVGGWVGRCVWEGVVGVNEGKLVAGGHRWQRVVQPCCLEVGGWGGKRRGQVPCLQVSGWGWVST